VVKKLIYLPGGVENARFEKGIGRIAGERPRLLPFKDIGIQDEDPFIWVGYFEDAGGLKKREKGASKLGGKRSLKSFNGSLERK